MKTGTFKIVMYVNDCDKKENGIANSVIAPIQAIIAVDEEIVNKPANGCLQISNMVDAAMHQMHNFVRIALIAYLEDGFIISPKGDGIHREKYAEISKKVWDERIKILADSGEEDSQEAINQVELKLMEVLEVKE